MTELVYINSNTINSNNKRPFEATIMSCNICADKLNSSTRKPIICSYCEFPACRTC